MSMEKTTKKKYIREMKKDESGKGWSCPHCKKDLPELGKLEDYRNATKAFFFNKHFLELRHVSKDEWLAFIDEWAGWMTDLSSVLWSSLVEFRTDLRRLKEK